ncbi:basG [Acinetobacter baumannii]|nr:basG [Acinetobacter baumannii]
MILPFVDHPQAFSFAHGIDSICVSGHKMIGSPIPCGIVVAKRQNVERISVDVDYISTRDQTISGSRNGHTVLLMWAAIRSQTNLQRRQRIQHCLKMAQYAVDRFQAVGIPAWRNPNSTSGNMAHLITTAHHRDTRQIDSLIDDVIFDLQGASKRTVGF